MFQRFAIICILMCSCIAITSADSPTPASGTLVSSAKWGDIWTCSAASEVKPEMIAPKGTPQAVSISAARNEYEPFQLVLRAAKALTGVSVAPRTLTGPNGAKLPAWNISVRRVGSVSSQGMPTDALPELQPFTPKPLSSIAMWVTVYVPEKTPAGGYSGVIDVMADGGVKSPVKVKLHVWDFSLPTVSRLRTAFDCSYDGPVKYQSATTPDQKRKLVDLYNMEFWRHRVSPTRPYAFYDVTVEKAGEALKVDFSQFDIAVKKYFATFNAFEMPGFGIGDSFGLDLGDDYQRLKIEYMRTVAEHLQDKGQVGKGYADLLKGTPDGAISQLADAVDMCGKADDRIKVLLVGTQEPKNLNLANIWAADPVSQGLPELKARQAKGTEVWLDGTQFFSRSGTASVISSRFLPWIAWNSGATGIRYGEIAGWSDDQNLDNALIYPPTKAPSAKFVEKGPVPSIRWELVREGIEDYDYFRLLQERIDKAQKTGADVSKAQEALKMVTECTTSASDYTRDPARLQAARAKVAQAIEGLRQ